MNSFSFQETLCFNEEAEKEQSSPVSVLDFPYDHDDGDSSPFTLRVSRLKGTIPITFLKYENI